jgi:glycosyltransferase involved in cell wall biosynthesis
MEQTLGHVTHSRNLHTVIEQQERIDATWLPIPFDLAGPARLVPVLRSNWSVRASWRARRALGGALRRAPHAALFFHSQVTSLFSMDLMRRYPSIVSLDATPINFDTMADSYNHRAAGTGFVDRKKYELNRRAFQAASALVTWSEWAKSSLATDYGVDPARVRVLAPGAAQEFFEIGDRRQVLARPTTDLPRVLFVGGDFARKGGPHLLDALPEGCQLDIVTKEAVEPRPNVRVHHGLGPNSPELRRLFESADLFVLPSLGECLAMVLMEATAAGLPVITTRVGALDEAVLPGESGLVVPVADVAALRTALETLVADRALRLRMGKAGRQLARQKFSARSNNQSILHLLSDVADTRHTLGRTA